MFGNANCFGRRAYFETKVFMMDQQQPIFATNKSKIRQKLEEYARVLKITRKPTGEEFSISAKITGLGILFIGAIGFVIYLISIYTGIFG